MDRSNIDLYVYGYIVYSDVSFIAFVIESACIIIVEYSEFIHVTQVNLQST